jgi:glutaredoxin
MRVTLYTKPECHLCEDVKADLQVLQMEIGFVLHEHNIENDAASFERYRYLIPVVDIANGPMLYAPIDPVALHRALQSAAQRDAGC